RRDLPGSYYANGWGVFKTDDCTTLLSNGAIAGCASSLVVILGDEIAIVCLSNSTVGNEYTDKIAFEIVDGLRPGYLKKLNTLISKAEQLLNDKPFVFVEQYEGTWSGRMMVDGNDIPLTIRFEGSGKVVCSFDGQPETELQDLRICAKAWGFSWPEFPPGFLWGPPASSNTILSWRSNSRLQGSAASCERCRMKTGRYSVCLIMPSSRNRTCLPRRSQGPAGMDSPND
ncbi:MAG: hypothetical protein ABR951_11425, partial [Candidatus Aminicenantales bacterium]